MKLFLIKEGAFIIKRYIENSNEVNNKFANNSCEDQY